MNDNETMDSLDVGPMWAPELEWTPIPIQGSMYSESSDSKRHMPAQSQLGGTVAIVLDMYAIPMQIILVRLLHRWKSSLESIVSILLIGHSLLLG